MNADPSVFVSVSLAGLAVAFVIVAPKASPFEITSRLSLGLVVPIPTLSVLTARAVALPAPSWIANALEPVLPATPSV